MNFNANPQNEDFILSSMIDEGSDFIPIIADNDDILNNSGIPEDLPIMPLKNTVLFPGVIIPISVGRKKSIRLIKSAYKKDRHIGIVTQRDSKIDDPSPADLYEIGTLAKIIKVLEMPDNSTTIIIQGIKRFKLEDILCEHPYMRAKVSEQPDLMPEGKDKEFDALISSLTEVSIKIIELSSHIPKEAIFALKNIESPRFLINFICSNSDLEPTNESHSKRIG